MSKEIWIKSGNKVVGPGTVEQFLNAFRKGTLRANSTFSTQSSGSWLPLSEFPPAAPLAVEANGWFWVSTGFASDDQIGPCDGKELLQERDQQIGKATAVAHNIFTRGEWVEFQTTLLEVTHQNALAAVKAEALIARQKQEQLRLEQIQLERERQEAEAARQQQVAEQQLAEQQLAAQQQAATVAQNESPQINFLHNQMQTIQNSIDYNTSAASCWHCELPNENLTAGCVYCRML
jgi:hypothetical protein